MTSTVRYGLKLAASPLTLLRPPLHRLRRPPFASTVARVYRLHPALHTYTSTPRLADNYTENTAAEVMDLVSESQETVPSQSEAALSPRPPTLKPGDSFGSEFYGELNDFSLESPKNDVEKLQDEEAAASGSEEEPEPPFELTFKRKPLPEPTGPDEIPKAIPPSLWSHQLYQGPDGQDIIVDYCCTFEQSESVAQHFLNEPVLGLDMEWHCFASPTNIKQNASVLQLACEDRIAIFHLARHKGNTAAEILPPTLKKIIESDEILKAGVNIYGADAPKLRKLNLEPKGLFELSHLYNLIANKRTAGGHVPKYLKKLNEQSIEKLGLPLEKGSVRTSDWTKELNQAQIDYAAADAYAGFMLFHVMNEERKQMKPTPPLPAFAELGLPVIGISEKEADAEELSDCSNPIVRTIPPQDQLQGLSLRLYEKLCLKRAAVAAARGMKSIQLASNSALARVATAQPRTLQALRQVKGMGDTAVQNFGRDCILTIERFLTQGADNVPDDVIIDDPIISTPPRKKQGSTTLDASSRLLFDTLCIKRKELAAEERISSFQYYRIANNNVLTNIANRRPTTFEELLEISGIGNYSAKKFGEHWLSVVNSFIAEIPENFAPEEEAHEDNGSEEMMSEDDMLNISADNLPPGAEGCLSGERIVFTGILDALGRTGAQDLARKCGAEVLERPDTETTLVVTGRDVSENKLQSVAEYRLHTATEEDFIGLVFRKSREAHATATRQRAERPLGSLSALTGTLDPVTVQQVDDLPPSERAFHNALRALRTQLASLSKMPAASICSDADLRAIAIAQPPTRADFLRLPGGKGLDAVARQTNKSINDFLAKHNRSVPAVSRTTSREPQVIRNVESSEESDQDHAFEELQTTAPTKRFVYGEVQAPPSSSRKRKF
ncbi:Replication factor C subunit 1 [Lasiodiplodia theobromae]|uniref:Replication factor C subunit 1 n=1 Tax=Lasiodiplodia theobromae TaxID=45133 RepID=A0A5N5DFU8_9PEZI|nr:Replication factor C subunit 1 [Lasiodiplodia theobromae]